MRAPRGSVRGPRRHPSSRRPVRRGTVLPLSATGLPRVRRIAWRRCAAVLVSAPSHRQLPTGSSRHTEFAMHPPTGADGSLPADAAVIRGRGHAPGHADGSHAATPSDSSSGTSTQSPRSTALAETLIRARCIAPGTDDSRGARQRLIAQLANGGETRSSPSALADASNGGQPPRARTAPSHSDDCGAQRSLNADSAQGPDLRQEEPRSRAELLRALRLSRR